jgi:hypothetical protein
LVRSAKGDSQAAAGDLFRAGPTNFLSGTVGNAAERPRIHSFGHLSPGARHKKQFSVGVLQKNLLAGIARPGERSPAVS